MLEVAAKVPMWSAAGMHGMEGRGAKTGGTGGEPAV